MAIVRIKEGEKIHLQWVSLKYADSIPQPGAAPLRQADYKVSTE